MIFDSNTTELKFASYGDDHKKKDTKDIFSYEFKENTILSYNLIVNEPQLVNVYYEKTMSEEDLGLIFGIIIICLIILGSSCFYLFLIVRGCIDYKKEKEYKSQMEMRLLEKEKLDDKSKELYNLIKRDYKLIEKNCLICSNIDLNPIIPNDDNNIINTNYNNNNYSIKIMIRDINYNTFVNFYDYITPKKCNHFYHEECWKQFNKKECLFCEHFITLENMEKFGCFFTENDFVQIIEAHNKHYGDYNSEKLKQNIVKNIKNAFDSIIEENPESVSLYKLKKDKLIKMKEINDKFLKNFNIINFKAPRDEKEDYFKYYKLSIFEDLDEIETELDRLIRNKKEEKREYDIRVAKWMEEEEEREREYNHRQYIQEKNEREVRERERKGLEKVHTYSCKDCKKYCAFCGGNVRDINLNEGNKTTGDRKIMAHKKCLDNLNKLGKCIKCGKSSTSYADNYCYRCRWRSKERFLDRCYLH